jgi:hypothetical protein
MINIIIINKAPANKPINITGTGIIGSFKRIGIDTQRLSRHIEFFGQVPVGGLISHSDNKGNWQR